MNVFVYADKLGYTMGNRINKPAPECVNTSGRSISKERIPLTDFTQHNTSCVSTQPVNFQPEELPR